MNIYGVYDMKNKEQCLRVGTLIEIIKFLGISVRCIDKAIKKQNLIKQRYRIYYLFEEREEVHEIR